MCTEVQIVADPQQYVGIVGLAKPAGTLDDCLESGPDFRWRRGDDREDVAARSLVGKGLGEIARSRLYLIKQPHILDRDHRLVSEGLDQFDLPVGERPHDATQQRERANRLAFAQERYSEDCPGIAAQSLAFGE